eukprot:scaffold34.g4505.t1
MSGSTAAHGGGEAAEEQAAVPARGDRTGTWNGPAPGGYEAEPRHAQDAPASSGRAGAAQAQPSTVLLPGGGRMPLLGLGTYKLASADSVRAALDLGYRHLDCASVYGNQALVGEGLKTFLAEGRREELFITSKVWNDAHRPAAARASVERTLAELGCGHLDLLLLHWPEAWMPGTQEPDTGVTLQETWAALEACVDAGLARYIGVSNFGLTQVEDLLSWARIKPVVNQVELHPLLAQRKLVGVCLRKGVHSVAYSPLGHSKTDLLEHPAVLEVLLRWNVQRGVAAIPKAGSLPHLRENIEGLFSWALTWDQKAKLDALDCGRRLVTSAWHQWEDPEEGGAAKPHIVLQ